MRRRSSEHRGMRLQHDRRNCTVVLRRETNTRKSGRDAGPGVDETNKWVPLSRTRPFEGAPMKSRFTACISALTLCSAPAIPLHLAAQDGHGYHHHYQLIDLGTLGGPASYINNDPSGTGAASSILSPRGVVVGAADTSIPDPSCSNCFVSHAFQAQNGLMTDLGALPGVNYSFANWISPGGLVAGLSQNGAIDPLLGVPEINAVLWKDGAIVNLGTIEGGYESNAFAVNDRGQV